MPTTSTLSPRSGRASLSKLRCRLLDRETGEPQPDITVTLFVGVNGVDGARLPLASLCSDPTGYLAFDLEPLGLDLLSGRRLYLSAPAVRLRDHDVIGSLLGHPAADAEPPSVEAFGDAQDTRSPQDLQAPGQVGRLLQGPGRPFVFVVYVTAAADSAAAGCSPRLLPSIQAPDANDYEASPYSFVAAASVRLGDDCCASAVPSNLPVRQYSFYDVVVHRDNVPDFEDLPRDPSGDGPDRGVQHAVPGVVTVSGELVASSRDVTFGEVLEYKQDWHSLGHCLGELQYSLPLAPGESTQLAVLDWARSDSASRTDDLRVNEFLDHDLRRDRAIDETVEAALREEQGGNSHMGSTSGTASGSQNVTWTGNHAFGGGISYSYGKRNLEGDNQQDLHDRVRQASASVRSAKSTVIVQGAQAENSTVQTRRVANHNHCHALTIQYYEVLRQYRVVTRFTGRRPVVLLPFALIAFGWQMALRFRTALTGALLDPAFEGSFDALLRLHQVPEIYIPVPVLPGPGKPADPAMLEKSVKVTGTDEGGVGSAIMVQATDKLTVRASGLLALTQNSTVHGYNGVGPEGDGHVAPAGGANPFVAPGAHTYGLIYKIGAVDDWHEVIVGPFGDRPWTFAAANSGELIFSINDQRGLFADNTRPSLDHWTVNVSYPSHETAATPTDPSKPATVTPRYSKVEDQLSEARLLSHFSNNAGYYNTAVWMLMDVVERRLYIEQALRLRRNLLDGIDDRPLAVSGSSVAFAFRGVAATPEPDGEVTTLPELCDIVTLPTRGLFAEAEMGHCNSCEKRDVTRMWDWNEMTTETPPEISGVAPGPRGTAPVLSPMSLPGAVVQITQPQSAPDPNGLGDALRTLGTKDIFRDMAGLAEVSQLLGQLVAAAGDANSRQLAARAKDKVDAVAANAKETPAGDPSGVSAADSADRMSLLPQIKSVAKDLKLSDDDYKEFALNEIYGTRPTRPATPKPAKNGSVLSLFVEGRVSRDGKTTQEPLSGLLSLYLSRSLANAQDVPLAVLIDMTQGVGGNKITVVRDEPYMLRPVIRISADAIANRLDEALAAIRFELPGLELAALTSLVRSKYSSSHASAATGSTYTFPAGENVATFELLANVETVENASTEVVLDGKVGVTGNAGAQAGFDSSKLADLAAAITEKLLDAESRAAGGLLSGVLNAVTVKAQLGNATVASGALTVGSKLVFKPQVLRSISLQPK